MRTYSLTLTICHSASLFAFISSSILISLFSSLLLPLQLCLSVCVYFHMHFSICRSLNLSLSHFLTLASPFSPSASMHQRNLWKSRLTKRLKLFSARKPRKPPSQIQRRQVKLAYSISSLSYYIIFCSNLFNSVLFYTSLSNSSFFYSIIFTSTLFSSVLFFPASYDFIAALFWFIRRIVSNLLLTYNRFHTHLKSMRTKSVLIWSDLCVWNHIHFIDEGCYSLS